MDNTKAIIQFKNTSYDYKTYSEKQGEDVVIRAVNGVTLDIKKGEFVAVLGHNGSGKSTLSKHINALLLPTDGDVFVKGYNTKDYQFVFEIRKTAGMVFQNPDNQIVAGIVEEDVAFGPENLGVPPQEIRQRVDTALATLNMTEYAASSPHFLSGGQKQRVAIAGVLALQPECIVLDEPTAMLDPVGRREVMNAVKKLNKELGITIVLITHFMEEAVQADRVVVIEDGKIIMNDTPKNVFSQVDKLKEVGLTVPQVTELAHSLRQSGVKLPEGILTIDEMVGAICQLKLKA